jgi:hypothetical protein
MTESHANGGGLGSKISSHQRLEMGSDNVIGQTFLSGQSIFNIIIDTYGIFLKLESLT